MNDTFRTISGTAVGEFKDKGSKFLAFAFPVECESLVKNKIAEIKKKYHDARHHCYAYKIGCENNIHRVNDDGEPSGTAGKPIYGQILSFDVTNILLVVVRYFGGRLLGKGGLIHAYRSAAEDVLNHAEIIEKTINDTAVIHFGYELLNDINHLLNRYECMIMSRVFEEKCHFTVHIRKGRSAEFTGKLDAFRDIRYELNIHSG
jgi:uncharacterized YigZ family protein